MLIYLKCTYTNAYQIRNKMMGAPMMRGYPRSILYIQLDQLSTQRIRTHSSHRHNTISPFQTLVHSIEYSERLVSLKLHSLQRRHERYCIIYDWKIIEGMVSNFSKPIVCSYSERRGRSCIISHVNLGRLGSLAYNSFRW